ncbi:endonuclease domain-containing protein [Conyzicola sp.]|uniref:endonuclease domain-containing protein n=1 Tax=Conyzicola sp. TaxID=1969404 RepID=UPI00398981A4
MNPRIPLPDPLDSGPFSYAQARARGVSPGRLRGPDLRRPFHGARDPGTKTDVVARCHAYRPVMRHDAFFCSVTAAVIAHVPLPARLEHGRLLHVAVPQPVRAPEGKGIRGHSVQVAAGDVRDWDGLRISAPERLWCELSAVLTVPQLVAAGDYLVQRHGPHTSIERLAGASAMYPGRIGGPKRAECLPYLDPGSESPMESELRVIVITAKIPGFVANLSITVPGARYRGDLAFPHKKVIVEYQSEYHFDPAQRRKDMTRIDRLQAAGWFVMQVNLNDLNDPDELVARIRSVLDSRPTV